jgi:succinate dehydrogenase flavin-adding protein (antitoxin of CptAB toxin-antitoxin module)
VFNNKKYFYLSNESLSRDFSYILEKNDNDNPYDIRFCTFHINGNSKEPFLQFFLEISRKENEDKNVLGFPGFIMETSLFKNNYDDESHNVSNIFENECCHRFKNLTDDVSDDIIHGAYRGFIEHNNIIYAFFDSTYFDLKQTDKQLWCILDEFINERKVYVNNFTDDNIPLMFHDNDFIVYITDENGDRVTIPCCLYLCKLNEDETDYINVYVDDQEKGTNSHRILHYVFGNNCLFFTTDPIEKEDLKRLRMIKRYATFIDKSLYVLNINKDIENINFDMDEEDDDISYDGVPNEDIPKSHYKYSCIYFFENYKQLWCVKDLKRFTEITTTYVFPPYEPEPALTPTQAIESK